MPSGYTADLYDLKEVSFQDFVIGCASAFIPEARDMGMLKKLPDAPSKDSVYNYYRYSIEAIDRLEEFLSLSYEEIAQMNESDYAKNLSSWKEYSDTKQKILSAYNNMLNQVIAWEPPTERHEGLKNFMIEQLKASIDFDGTISEMPKPITTEQYRANKIKRLRDDVEYYTNEHKKAVERFENNLSWLSELKKSIGL